MVPIMMNSIATVAAHIAAAGFQGAIGCAQNYGRNTKAIFRHTLPVALKN
jgi:hypothetical protein